MTPESSRPQPPPAEPERRKKSSAGALFASMRRSVSLNALNRLSAPPSIFRGLSSSSLSAKDHGAQATAAPAADDKTAVKYEGPEVRSGRAPRPIRSSESLEGMVPSSDVPMDGRHSLQGSSSSLAADGASAAVEGGPYRSSRRPRRTRSSNSLEGMEPRAGVPMDGRLSRTKSVSSLASRASSSSLAAVEETVALDGAPAKNGGRFRRRSLQRSSESLEGMVPDAVVPMDGRRSRQGSTSSIGSFFMDDVPEKASTTATDEPVGSGGRPHRRTRRRSSESLEGMVPNAGVPMDGRLSRPGSAVSLASRASSSSLAVVEESAAVDAPVGSGERLRRRTRQRSSECLEGMVPGTAVPMDGRLSRSGSVASLASRASMPSLAASGASAAADGAEEGEMDGALPPPA